MSRTIPIDQLADEVMKGLTEYADLATEDLKKAADAQFADVIFRG